MKTVCCAYVVIIKITVRIIRSVIDYGFAEAHTTFGMIGVKCWIYKGEVLKSVKKPAIAEGGEQ